MRLLSPLKLLLLGACCVPGLLRAGLQMVADKEPQCVFAGASRSVATTWHNTGTESVTVPLRVRLYQASSATATPMGDAQDWKSLQVLPGQTVLETNLMTFPEVKAGSRFFVQFADDKNQVLGHVDIAVYPTNVLKGLKPLAGENPPGVLDPGNQLKPLLKNLDLEFVDLETEDMESFSGKLAIIGPFQSKTQMAEGLSSRIDTLARRDVAVVWIQPPREEPFFTFVPKKLQPSFYFVHRPSGHTAVAVILPELVVDLPTNPRSQLNLIYFCQQALNPSPETLPKAAR